MQKPFQGFIQRKPFRPLRFYKSSAKVGVQEKPPEVVKSSADPQNKKLLRN